METFNKTLTTGGTVLDGYNKVQDSWAMQLDKLRQNWKAFIGVFVDAQLDGTVGSTVKKLNEYFDMMNKASKINKDATQSSSALNMGLGTLTDSLGLLGLASMLNLKKIKGMFTAILTSLRTLNPYLILFLAGLAAVQNLNKLSIGPHMSTDEIDAIYKENEAYHERQKEIAKAKEAIDKEHKALANLKTQMDTMALSDFNFKLKDINDTFKEGMKDVYGMGEALQSLTELEVKLNMPSMDKKFRENAEKIKSFDEFYINGTTEEGIKELADKKIRDKFDVRDVEGGKGVVDRKTFLYGAAANIRENYLFMSPTTEEDYYKKIQSYIPKEKGNFKQESLKEIDRLTKEKKKDDEYFFKKMQEYVSLEGKRTPQTAENLKFAEYAKAEGNKDKQNKIAEENKWSSNDLNRLTKERDKFVKQDTEIKAKQGEIKNELNKNISLFTKWGRTQADFNLMISTMDKHAMDMAKNTTAEYEQRVQVLADMTKALSEISDKISEIQLKQAESFMKLNNYKNLNDFKKGLDKVGLSSYKGLIKEFSGVIDSYASQGAKMDFMNGKFMDMVGAIQSFSNAQEKLKKNIGIVGAGAAVDSLGDKTGQSIAQLYGKLSRMKGGIGGVQAAKEMNKYNSDTLEVLNKINEAYGEIGEIDKLKAMEKTNASIQQKSLITAEKYKTNLDEQYISIQRINAGKLRGYELDKSMSDLSYQTTLNTKKAEKSALEKHVGVAYSDLIKKGSPTTITLPSKSFGNFARDVLGGTSEINLADVKQIESAVEKIDKFKKQAPDSEIFNSASDIIDIIYKIDKINKETTEATVKNIQETMVSDKARFEAQQEYFNNYLDYLSKSEQEITIMEYKKQMLLTQSELEKDANESLSLKVQALKLADEISARTIENSKKLLEIEAERAKYAVKRQAYFGSDLVALQTEYDITKNLLNEEKIRLENKKKNFETTTTDTSLNKQAMENLSKDIQDRKAELEKIPKGTTDKFEVEKAAQLTREIEKQTSQYALLEKISKMTDKEREEYLKNSVEYKTILRDIDKNSFDTNEADLQNWKEKLRIEYELLDIAYDMKTIKSETEKEKSRNLYKEVFGNQTFDEAESKANIEKAKQLEINAIDKVEKFKEEANKVRIRNQKRYDELSSKSTKEKLSQSELNEFVQVSNALNSSLDENVEVQNAIKLAQEAGYNVLKATNEEELKRIQYLRQQVESVLDIVDALSKGEGIKFNPSQAIKGASGALIKFGSNLTAEGRYKAGAGKANNENLKPSDYAQLAQAGAGILTNVMGQVYDSQMTVVNAEISNLERRKKLATSEKERQKIDKDILDKQMKLIDLQYQKSTQTAGITGVAGSALGGALSGATTGAMLGMKSGNPLFALAGAGVGLISGIFGGKAEEASARRQKEALQADYITNIAENLVNAIKSATEEIAKGVFDAVSLGFEQAKKEVLKNLRSTTTFQKAMTINNEAIGSIVNAPDTWSGLATLSNAFGIKTGGSKKIGEEREKVKNEMIAIFTDINKAVNSLNFNSSVSEIDTVQAKLTSLEETLSQEKLKLDTGADVQGSITALNAQIVALQDYVDQIELINSKQNVFTEQYFGFDVNYIKDENGKIINIEKGTYKKREDLLNNFVEYAIKQSGNISKNVADIVIQGFADAFTRNNVVLNKALDKFENDVTAFADTLVTNGKTQGGSQFMASSDEIKTLVADAKSLNEVQTTINSNVAEFVSYWVKAGGSITDVIDMMPEFTKTLQSAMQNSFGETDFTDRFNSIGSALKSTIETKLNEVSFNKLQEQFLATNTSLTALMSGDLTMNNMAQLSQGIAKYTAQAEQSAYKTKAMLDMLQLDQTVDYGVSNTQVEYKTGSTNTNVYNINNNVTTTIGNLLGDARAMQNFTDSIVGYMVESMQKQGVLKK